VSVTVSVCLLVTFLSPAKTAEPIEVPFGGLTQMTQESVYSMGVQNPQGEGQFLGVVRPIEKHGNHYSDISGIKKNQ